MKRWPPLEQRAAPVQRNDPLHFIGTCIQIVLQHLDGGLDFVVGAAVNRKLMRTSHHPGTVNAVFDVEFAEDASHIRLLLCVRRTASRTMRQAMTVFQPFLALEDGRPRRPITGVKSGVGRYCYAIEQRVLRDATAPCHHRPERG